MKSIFSFTFFIVLNLILLGCSQENDERVNQTENAANTTNTTQTSQNQLEKRVAQLEKRVEQLEQQVEQQSERTAFQREFQRQQTRALETEAKNQLGAINRAQQAYRLENVQFASSLDDLSIGVPNSTENYQYKIQKAQDYFTVTTALAKTPKEIKNFAGIIYLDKDTQAISMEICSLQNSSNLSSKLAMDNVVQNDEVVCP
ncbi:type IV pilin-like G/H family protein [Geitlerinema sp. PCC 9228]|jgi:type II secretory pathway pseudopilin PulG|uniref:type IV pilin-like G/H family protein n=1 Tax=Geitlerinema sp. PCC 9228 TaxID=111611 RepID=UPI000A05F938|nr:type IV pilin-like G/H family protein [Geitlerinema sp. PCC 9228]